MSTEINGNISVPVSISGTLVTELYLASVITISPSISGTMFSPLHYDCEGGDVFFPAFSVDGSGTDEGTGVANVTFPAITVSVTGILSPSGTAEITFPLLATSASGRVSSFIASATVSFPKFALAATGLLNTIGSASVALPAFRLTNVALVPVSGKLSKAFPELILSATGLLSVNATGTITWPSFSLDSYTVYSSGFLSMCLNARNKALSLYNNYDFNSFCRYNGRHFGATSTAIYDLDSGTTDNGTVIDWNFRTPYLDLEQKQKKRITQAWLSYKSSGNLIVTILQPDGEYYEYDLESVDIYEDGLRVKFGKGIRSKYVAIDFKNIDGSTVEVDALRINLANLKKIR